MQNQSLTPKQEKFCLAYLETGNASEAYRRAYGKKDKSDKSVNELASHLLKNVKVASRLAELKQPANEAAQLSIEITLRSLAQAIFFDPRKLYREDCSLKPVTELDDDTAMALAGIEVVEMAGSLRAWVKARGAH
jgi:hypothetical protein